MKKFTALVYPVLSGLLLWASWPVSPLTFLIFIAWVPFLLVERETLSRGRYFYQVYLMLLIWNVGTTWWVSNSTLPGGIAAMLANSLLMSIPWMAYYQARKVLKPAMAYAALVVFWLSFEYIHLNWQLSWPWLTLGNCFASHPSWIQWYEYTGTSGGTLWILLVNLAIAGLIRAYRQKQTKLWQPALTASLALLLPFVWSWITAFSFHFPAVGRSNIVVVQPNIDPYEKFEPGMQDAQLQQMLHLSAQQIDSATVLVVWPETALNLPTNIEETRLHDYPTFEPLWNFLKAHPHLKLLTGIESERIYTANNRSSTARLNPYTNTYFDSYNAAALLDSNGTNSFYHKSKFVPGVETLPTYLRFLDTWFAQFGGTTSGYVMQEERTVMVDSASGLKIAPSICYESIYGEFMSRYSHNGANIIAIITNDGWWANTSGHKQHKEYARLRAIENRRWVVRSANTGISCFIAPTGELFDQQPWDTAAAIKFASLPLTGETFYARYGDLISQGAMAFGAVTLLMVLFLTFQRKRITIAPRQQ